MSYFDSKYLVLGIGKTGTSCIRYLDQKQAKVRAYDTRMLQRHQIPQSIAHIPITLGNQLPDFDWADRILISPGIAPHDPIIDLARSSGKPMLSDIQWFTEIESHKKFIGITGSNGKSTVTALTCAILQKAGIRSIACGNLGHPVMDCIDQQIDVYVLELSSFQLFYSQNLPLHAAALLNISEDHLDWHGLMTHYTQSKQSIFSNAQHRFFFLQDRLTHPPAHAWGSSVAISDETEETPITSSLFQLRFDSEGLLHLCYQSKPFLSSHELLIKGKHNAINALFACALASSVIPFEPDFFSSVLRNFNGLPHRCVHVAQQSGVHWYNDTKATNVGSAIASIEGIGIEHPIILIAGGISKSSMQGLAPALRRYVKHLITIGRDGHLIASWAHCPVTPAYSMADAIHIARKIAIYGDAVLLAPGCASFDWFENFEHRGRVFTQLVLQT